MIHHNFNLSLSKFDEIKQILEEKGSLKLNSRDRLGFLEEYIELIALGRKKTTIRFRRGMIDCPVDSVLPIFSISNNVAECDKEFGWAQIINLRILPFKDLNENDALKDGFISLTELKNALMDIYGEIGETELVSIYEFDYWQKD